MGRSGQTVSPQGRQPLSPSTDEKSPSRQGLYRQNKPTPSRASRGIEAAGICLRTGRLRYTVALHMLINFLGSIVPMAMIKYMETDELAGALMVYGNLFAEFLCMIFGVILLIVFRRQVYFKRTDWQIPANRCWAVVFGNAGMLLFLAYCIGNFLLQ